jgi:hypothetical protein
MWKTKKFKILKNYFILPFIEDLLEYAIAIDERRSKKKAKGYHTGSYGVECDTLNCEV